MHLGIDASNIRQGGGLTHLAQLLAAAEPLDAGFSAITVWCGLDTARALPQRFWLRVRSEPWMDAALPRRFIGQQVALAGLVKREACDVVFSPGGTLPARCPVPVVTMSQNLLPFEPDEARRFGIFHPMRWKMRLLRQTQGRSFRRADGIIFLTQYAKDTVAAALGGLSTPTTLVPHGVEPRFVLAPRQQRSLADYTLQRPFKLLYVSILMPYKHQIELAQAVTQLRKAGMPVELRLVGAPWGNDGPAFQRCIDRLDPQRRFLIWQGAEPFSRVADCYKSADAFVFASSCENLPNIMIEAMAAGLPIASSHRGPMPEVLGQPACYFDPDSVDSIAEALRQLMTDCHMRQEIADAAWQKAATYSWSRCAQETLGFIASVAKGAAV